MSEKEPINRIPRDAIIADPLNKIDSIYIGKILALRGKNGKINKICWSPSSQTYYITLEMGPDATPAFETITSWEISQLEKSEDWD